MQRPVVWSPAKLIFFHRKYRIILKFQSPDSEFPWYLVSGSLPHEKTLCRRSLTSKIEPAVTSSNDRVLQSDGASLRCKLNQDKRNEWTKTICASQLHRHDSATADYNHKIRREVGGTWSVEACLIKKPCSEDACRAKAILLSQLLMTEFKLLLQFWGMTNKKRIYKSKNERSESKLSEADQRKS